MNRPIKFRAWDTYNKEWIYLEIENANQLWTDNWYTAEKLENLGQFTGLLDKHRNEVYEGDVIKINNGSSHKKRAVKYTKGLHNVPLAKFTVFEIIGNIYENPELLSITE